MDSDLRVTARKFIYDEKDKSCKSCLKPLETTADFLRHVGHKELCLSFYGKDYVQAIRQESRRISKRNWAYANEEKTGPKKSSNRKKTHVPNKVKLSEPGRAFGSVFRRVFDPAWNEAKEWIAKEGDKLFLLSEEKVVEVLDEAFDVGLSNAIQYPTNPWKAKLHKVEDEEGWDEQNDLDFAFSMIESAYDQKIDILNSLNTFNWKTWKTKAVSDRLYDFSLNQAFLALYNEEQIKGWLEPAKDATLDEMFLDLIVNGYFDINYKIDDEDDYLESRLETFFHGTNNNKVNEKAKEAQLDIQMKTLLHDILQKKILYHCNLKYPSLQK